MPAIHPSHDKYTTGYMKFTTPRKEQNWKMTLKSMLICKICKGWDHLMRECTERRGGLILSLGQ